MTPTKRCLFAPRDGAAPPELAGRHPANFEDGLSAIVSAGGDTDTNGAIAGAVLGARFGHQAIPKRWRDHVAAIRDYTPPVANWPRRERLEDLADRVLASRQPA